MRDYLSLIIVRGVICLVLRTKLRGKYWGTIYGFVVGVLCGMEEKDITLVNQMFNKVNQPVFSKPPKNWRGF